MEDIVNSRLEWWAETNNVLNVPISSWERTTELAIDTTFISNSLIQHYKKQKKTLFAYFVEHSTQSNIPLMEKIR